MSQPEQERHFSIVLPLGDRSADAVNDFTHSHRLHPVKRLVQRAFHKVSRTSLAARTDAVHSEARLKVARKVGEGNAWQGVRENVALFGLRSDSGSRPKMI